MNKDLRINKLQAGRNIRKDLALVLDCQESQISLTNHEALSGNIVYHYGNLNFYGRESVDGVIFPTTVIGSLYLNGLKSADGVIFPTTVGGSLELERLESANRVTLPTIVWGDLWLQHLKSAEGVIFPTTIGGYLWLQRLKSADGLVFPPEFEIQGKIWLTDLPRAEWKKLKRKYPHLADKFAKY
ncbi:MAG TPA: hypothetical protein PKL09_02495 [bacterium]|nr:hypothetical protein [bacterium]HNS34387.1 hypothetical protein [bacterium]HNW09504.1 hypothetical protein [bacterium]HPN81172.1 hypothetical protein [bacterium]HPW39207.1 hypothetical protein [bacterium]